MNVRDKLLRKSRHTKEESDIAAYKSKRNEVNIAVRKAKSVYYKDLLKENSKDPIWKTVKSIFATKTGNKRIPQTFDTDGVKVKDPKEIANALCSFFTGVVLTLKEKITPLSNFTWRK